MNHYHINTLGTGPHIHMFLTKIYAIWPWAATQ